MNSATFQVFLKFCSLYNSWARWLCLNKVRIIAQYGARDRAINKGSWQGLVVTSLEWHTMAWVRKRCSQQSTKENMQFWIYNDVGKMNHLSSPSLILVTPAPPSYIRSNVHVHALSHSVIQTPLRWWCPAVLSGLLLVINTLEVSLYAQSIFNSKPI